MMFARYACSPDSPILVVRGGVNSLTDEVVLRAAALTRTRWGIDGISVYEAPDGDLVALAHRVRAMAERPLVRTAFAAVVRAAGFPLLDTRGELHWTIVLADLEPATLQRPRSVFGEPIDNPGYQARPRR